MLSPSAHVKSHADEIVAIKTVDGSQFRSIAEIEQMQVSVSLYVCVRAQTVE